MELNSITIDYTARTEHPSLLGNPQRDWRTEPVTVAGYNAVYELGGRWFAYSENRGGSSRSRGLPSREEAERRIREDVEHSVRFWQEKVRWREAGDRTGAGNRVVRVGGDHYVIRREPSERELAGSRLGIGMSGRRMSFRLLGSGEVVTSRNVFHQGTIPLEFRDLLPDNAERVQERAA